MGSVWIAGSYQSYDAREGLEISDMVEGWLRRTDCAQVTDGVAGVLLVSDRYRAERLGGKPSARIAGWGHGTAALPLQPKLDRSQGQPYVFPHVRQVVTDAFRRAQIPGVGAVSFVVTAGK